MRSSIFLASIILAFSLGSASVASAQRFSPLGKYSSFSEKFNLKNPGWFVGLGTGASFTPNSNAQNSFRGSGLSSKIFGGYYFGNIGLVISSGMASGSVSEEALNKFITDRGIQPSQLRILKGNPLNGYLLAGPSVRFGGKVFVNADLLGGLFLNSPGTIDLASQNSPLTLYRTDNGGKSISPGFSGSVRINYPLGNATHFFVGGDYLQSTVAINLTDLKSGIDQPTRFNREVKLLAAQVGITKSFGNNTEKRYRPGNNNILGNTINEAKQGTNCGPVTLTSTNADGSENQMTFACPDDAAQYSRQQNSMPSRLSMTPTTARQTQGKDFGEKVASGLQTATGIISGSIYWQPDNQPGIITNEMAAKGIGGMAKPGGAVSSSYAAGKMTNEGGTSNVQIVNLSISPRDNKTGLSAGKIQSGQVYNEFTNSACDNCGLKVTGTKEVPDISQQPQETVKNPLYSGNTNSGSNPLYNGNAITSSGGLCGTTSHFLVGLYDANNGMLIATTTADSCGNFWFANVPAGNYAIRIQGYSLVKKTYQLTVNEKQDIGGEMYGGNTQLITNLKATLGTANQIVDAQSSNERSTGFHSDTIILSPPVKGIPLKGVGVSLGKSPGGGAAARTATDENGSFVFPKVEKGTYQISVDVPFYINETTLISLGGKGSGGNGEVSQNNLERKGWDGSVKGSKVTDDLAKGWDGSVKGGSKVNLMIQFSVGPDGNLTGKLASQDDNATLGNTDQIADAQNSNERNSGSQSASTIIHSQPVEGVKGIPLKGVGVSLGKSPGGGAAARTATDENGSFVFPKVKKGTYKITVDVPFSVNESTLINLGANDYGGNGDVSQNNLERKGWDGSVKGGSKVNLMIQFSVGPDGNLTGKLATQHDNATLGNTEQIGDDQKLNERSSGSQSASTIIHSQPVEGVKGIPLKGVGVSLGKSPGGGAAARTATDENGSFVFPKVKKGTYKITVDVPFSVNETTLINLGAKDSGGNGGISQTSVKNKVWDGSVKGGSKADMIVQFSVGSDGNLTGRLATQDDIAAQSNKSYLIIGEDGTFSGRMEAQNFNTCRSNRERGQLKTNPDTDNNGGTNIMDQYQFSVKPDGSVIGKQVLKNASAASGKSLLNIMGDGTISGILYAQDFNTCRSNRDNRLAARPGQPTTDGSAMQNQQINKSKSNVKNNFIADSPIEQPTTDAPTTGTYNNKPGQPIGGIIVKGGRNPGGQMMTLTTNNNGEFSLDAKEAGTYSFEISYPPTNQKGIREAGIKRTEAVALRVSGGGKGIVTGTGGNAHAVIKPRHETAKNSIANVRLATNSGDDITVVEDGEFLVEITEPGHYVIQATTPEPAGKGIQEAGVKRAEAQNFNTTRSNRERGQLNTNPDSENNSGTNVLGQIQFSIRPDGSVTGKQASQKSASVSGNSLLNILGDGTITGILYAQDFNTCRSNRERGMGFSTQTQGDGGTQRVYFSLKADGSLAGKLNEQDNNGAQANTSYLIVGSDGRLSGKLNAQDFNTCRSNREN